MITGRDFMFISSIEWGFLWQAHQEIASRLAAAGNRVLYIENMGVRTPGLRDAGRIVGRLKRWAAARRSQGIRQVAPNIHVCSPVVCPPFGPRWRRAINRRLFLPGLKRTARTLGFRDPIIWTYLPTDTGADVIRLLGSPESLVVYHCVADFTQLTPEVERLRKSEQDVLSLSDVVFASCTQLAKGAAQANDHVYLTPHGVDLAAFPYAGPLGRAQAAPVELENLPHPVIGYVGGIHRHVDLDLIRQIALRRPEWTWVLVGSVQVPVDELRDLPNVRMVGARPHDRLVDYIRQFDVCTVPYANTESTATVVPTKLNEYLAVGRPVVATDLPTLRELDEEHRILHLSSTDPDDFIAAIQAALRSGQDHALALRRRAWAERADWGVQLERISEIVQQRLLQRRQDGYGEPLAPRSSACNRWPRPKPRIVEKL
jgi:glycosyltransferase involved in cell wall biosynthesis